MSYETTELSRLQYHLAKLQTQERIHVEKLKLTRGEMEEVRVSIVSILKKGQLVLPGVDGDG